MSTTANATPTTPHSPPVGLRTTSALPRNDNAVSRLRRASPPSSSTASTAANWSSDSAAAPDRSNSSTVRR